MAGHDNVASTGSQRQTAAACTWEGALVGLGLADRAGWQAAALGSGVVWRDVLEEARRLRLAPLLHVALAATPDLRVTVPLPVADALRRIACATAARAAQLERVCADVAAAAAAAGVPVLVLKGPALGSLVYPATSARPMDDVDLLVAPEDRERLAGILRDHGYRNDLRGEEDFLDVHRSYSIDLHTGLVNTTRVPARGALWPALFDELGRRSQGCVLAGVPVRTLGPCDTLQHLAVHAVHHHGLEGALWMTDLLACMRAWPWALGGMTQAPPAVRRSFWYCLEVLAAHGQEPAPELRFALRPRRVFPGERWLLAARGRRKLPGEIRYALTVACLPRWRTKAAFLRQLLFPRAGVHTDGFGDGTEDVPGLGEHWREVMRLGREGLRATLVERTGAGRRPAKPN